MHSKSTTQNHFTQLPAGVAANDHNIEFVGCKDTKTVIWLQRGHSNTFENLPEHLYSALEELFLTDHEAVKILPNWFPEAADSLPRLVEIYTYYMYGDLDTKADVIDGKLQHCENFRDGKNCISLQFKFKDIDVNGLALHQRDIIALDAFAEGIPDKTIAHMLNITLPTFDFHKRNLFKKLGVNSKPEAVAKAYQHHIICAQ